MQADFLIIGSGIAALRAAAAVEGAGNVLILTKADPLEGNTGHAQGGIAAAVGPGDSPALHMADTLAAGDGLCDERAVKVLVEDGPRYVRELIAWGVAFDRGPGGEPELGLEAAHSVRRVLHVHDATGREIGRALWAHVEPMSHVRVHDHACVVGLVIEAGRCLGARFLDRDGTSMTARARCTLLATGGAGQVFRETTNPSVATGDGIAMAWRGGAAVADLEFVQFHPTALKMPGQPRFLLSEALRGEGARLVNAAGEAFMPRYDPAGDLAPRDRVARAIELEAKRTGGEIFLTLGKLDPRYVHERFSLISSACRRAGLDLATDRIPVGPAAHYVMGGVVTDVDGRTTIPGLFAAGEVACTGVHGANRLASNSLLEGLVFGARAGATMRAPDAGARSADRTLLGLRAAAEFGVRSADRPSLTFLPGKRPPDPTIGRSGDLAPAAAAGLAPGEAGGLMWEHAGLFRTADGLRTVLGRFGAAHADEPSVITVGRLIARAALRREESRGAHFRLDFPERNDTDWQHRVMETRE